jgi:hypothetical protein
MDKIFLYSFCRIYKLQDSRSHYGNPETLLEDVDPILVNLTQSNFRTYLKGEGLGDLIIEELIQAITFVNYGQDLNIHSFVGKGKYHICKQTY